MLGKVGCLHSLAGLLPKTPRSERYESCYARQDSTFTWKTESWSSRFRASFGTRVQSQGPLEFRVVLEVMSEHPTRAILFSASFDHVSQRWHAVRALATHANSPRQTLGITVCCLGSKYGAGTGSRYLTVLPRQSTKLCSRSHY